ncbi:putative polyketide synthase [Macroventuria anomochaeta]|uniref:Polyketide synthase n=1 Tax=Macroventuria anomochaeta TaxID=301207 RepID=A0ACB6S8K1_9PLEO|nr:putative polyketide synthase [Macroventuria anomochaeta]KAF2630541.1 putative polyketide synthase [Macroventuria anomochaeta]
MAQAEPIAIVGSGCRFAGGVDSPSKLWELLREPRDIRREIPRERFSVQGFYHPDGAYHGHSNVQHAYLLEQDPSHFDTDFFGIKPSEAKSMDPQQRILMETVYEAIEAAGMTISGLKGSDTSVFAGLMTNDYGMLLTRDLAHVPTYHATGISSAIVSNRVSYFFDWHGPSMTVDTGCSASLVALHLAVQSLRNGECGMALACGTNLILGPEYFVIESKLKMLSPDGQSKMWDQDANGYARGDGVTAVVLKTLSAALADGDHIECIIRETGLNQDGATPGITMPSASAQEALIRNVYAKAGLDLRSDTDRPQYFEAHGTGTPAGDPIEANAIQDAFFREPLHPTNGKSDVEEHPLYVGSIKTVLGHTEGSAGIAAILKTSLALQNATIPPNLLFNQLSDRVAPFYNGLEIARSAKPWPKLAPGQVRRASVNSFGFGGANAHAILESYEPPYHNGYSAHDLRLFTPFVFSSSSEKLLLATLQAYGSHLSESPDVNVGDLAWTLRQKRSLLPYRLSITADSIPDLASKIQTRLEQDGPSVGVRALPISTPGARHQILGVFTGQGAQYARMGAELIEQSLIARTIIDGLDQMLSELPLDDRPTWSLQSEILASAEKSRTHEARISQPVCTAVQIMVVDLLRHAKVEFAAVVGHSSGEIAAAYAAGFLTIREAIYIAYYRGLHLGLASSPRGPKTRGAMLAVGSSMKEMSELCNSDRFAGRISIAASNSSSSLTISGDEDAIDELKRMLDREAKFNRRLKVDKAYHSAHMKPCFEPYVASLNACARTKQTQKPNTHCLWFSSVYDEAIDPLQGVTAAYWAENMTKPVLFSQALTRATIQSTFDIALEVGPHPALAGPASQTIGEVRPSDNAIPYLAMLRRGTSALDAFSTGLGELWSRLDHSAINLDSYERALHGGKLNVSVVKGLPSRPWDHSTKHWHEARASRNMRLRTQRVHPLLGDATPDSTPHHLSWRNLLRIKEMEWLSGHEIQGQAVFPAAGYICSALEASRLLADKRNILLLELQDFAIHQAVPLPADDAGVEVLIELADVSTSRAGCVEAVFTYSAALGADAEDLTLAASARVTVKFGTPSTSTLPGSSTGAKLTHATNVDVEDYYSALAKHGYNFSGRFCSLSQLTRKHRISSSLVKIDPSQDGDASLLLHPAELDAAFQAILLAISYPNDEQLHTLHLPTQVRHIRVNPALCNTSDMREARFAPIEGRLVDVGVDSGIVGDVYFYSDSSPDAAMIQLQGARLVPLGGSASIEEDKQLYSTVHWIDSGLDGISHTRVHPDQSEMMKALERLSTFYLRQIEQELPADSPARSERPISFYLDHARRTTSLIDNGKHGWANKDWKDDTLHSVMDATTTFQKLPDVRLMHLVGQSMPRVLAGKTTMMEEFRRSNLLREYYAHGAVTQASASWIVDMMKQIVDRYPHLNILEIGAGAGQSVTERIPQAINSTLFNYTYANISGSIQKDGSAFFSEPNDPKPVKIFDAEADPASQGYVEGSYDVVIAFWVIHATTNLELTLRNLRRLLKPGGYLIIAEGGYNSSSGDGGLNFIFGTLPGWWLGADQGRVLSPYLSMAEWKQLLEATGFSGIEVSPPTELAETFGVATFVSQAVDDQMSYLRDPIGSASAVSPVEDLVLIGGRTHRSAHLMDGLQQYFSTSVAQLRVFGTLEEVDHVTLSQATTMVSLTELDEPVFLDMTAARFDAFKTLFGTGKTLLWVTNGRLTDEPYVNLTLGFGRTAVVETPDLRLQQLDLEDPQTTDPLLIAKTLLRFVQAVPESALWSVEPEIVVDSAGRELVPRLRPIPALNDRYNSSKRRIERKVGLEECLVSLEVTDEGYTAKVNANHTPDAGADLARAFLNLKTLYTSTNAIKTTVGHKFIVLCQDPTTHFMVLALVPSLASTYRLPVESVVLLGTSYDATFLSHLAAHLISVSILDTVRAGQLVALHNAKDPLATAIKVQASFRGIELLFTADSTVTDAVEPNLRLPPYMTQSELNHLLPGDISLFVGLSNSAEVRWLNEETIMSNLPTHCRRETVKTLSARQGLSSTTGTAEAIRTALKHIGTNLITGLPTTITVSSLLEPDHVLEDPLTVVDWTAHTPLLAAVTQLDAQQMFDDNKTYWILGLSAALAVSLFDWMIEKGAKNLVFTSRRPQLEEAWIESHKSRGVRVLALPCDITNEDALKTAHSTICSSLPPVGGILNGAALFRDTSISNMSLDQLYDVLRPKVLGSLYLDQLFYDQPLDFFILTASITGLLGSAGQANYTAANQFLCGLAGQRRKRGLAATAINLGAIAGVGLLEREDKKVLESIMQRLSLMPVSEGDFHQIIAEAIEFGRPDSSLHGPELTTALRAISRDTPNPPAIFTNPLLSHYLSAESDDKGARGPKGAKPIKELLAECETEEELQNIVKGAFSNELRKTLQSTSSDDDLMEMRSADLGIDSLVSIDLRTWFTKNLKVNMPVLKILSNDTIISLVLFAAENVPSEMVPNIASRAASNAHSDGNGTVNGNGAHANGAELDWDVETSPPSDLAEAATAAAVGITANPDPSTVLLTGASGLLGHHILTALLEQTSVKKIICIAVRRLQERLDSGELPTDKRIVYHQGELDAPRLGLSQEEAATIFGEIGAVIHNGADTSHLKSYYDLRPANVDSTIELIRWCLPRKIPMHFVSSNAVGRYSNKEEIGEVAINSPRSPKPPADGSSGYRSTKWVAEGLLEKVSDTYALPIWIHRPSTIIRTGKDAEGLAAQLDWMNALIQYMDKLSAVPKLNHVTGFLDLVHARTVCTGIVDHVIGGNERVTGGKVRYVHHMGDLLLPLARLEAIGEGSGKKFRQLPREEWTSEAVTAGMHPAVVVLLEMMDAPGLKGPPLFVKGPGSPHEP